MKCIIIEDQPPAQRILKKYIAEMESLKLKATFSGAIQAMEFLKAEVVDLIFLDIHLPKISGIDFLKTIPNSPYVILTTAFTDYALESYEFNVVDYLLKPFSFQRFVKAVAKVPVNPAVVPPPDILAPPQTTHKELFIKSGYEHIKITLADIIYLKSDADYIEIFIPGKRILSADPLRYWEENLNPDQFVRVHKSYIVNTAKIEKIVGNQLYLEGEAVVPIGRTYRVPFVNRFVK